MSQTVGRQISAANVYTAPVNSRDGGVTVHITGTFVATATLQMRAPANADGLPWVDDNAGWTDGPTWTAPIAWHTDSANNTARLSGHWQFRVGVKTGAYTSGTLNVWIGGADRYPV